MPKIVESPKTRTQIQTDSDAKRGIMTKSYKLHRDDVELIKKIAEQLNMAQNELIVKAIKEYAEKHQK